MSGEDRPSLGASTDANAALIAEQLRHTIDLLRAELDHVRQVQAHNQELAELRISALEQSANDHELRLRNVADGVTQFKMFAGLMSGGSGFVSVVALIRSWLGT